MGELRDIPFEEESEEIKKVVTDYWTERAKSFFVQKQRELNKAEKTAFLELSKALKDGEGNVDALLDAYIKAKQANVNLHFASAKEYKKAIGAEKTAKFFTCDEKFRRQQIGKLRGGHDGHKDGFRGGFKGAPKDGPWEGKDGQDGKPQKSK